MIFYLCKNFIRKIFFLRSTMANRFYETSSDSSNADNYNTDLYESHDEGDFLDDLFVHRKRGKKRKMRLPKYYPWKRLKYSNDDSDETDCEVVSLCFRQDSRNLIIKNLLWTISKFPNSEINTEGFIKSPIYTAGVGNIYQAFCVLEKLQTSEDTFYGLYICLLSNYRAKALVKYTGYIVEIRGNKYVLNKKQKFPKKPGFRFLGSIRKSYHVDDGYWSYRMIPEGDITLSVKVEVHFKEEQQVDDLAKLVDENEVMDVALIAGEKEFKANKKILSERSPTFAQMLKGNQGDKKLVISDIEPEVLRQILIFIYTGRVTKLFKYKKELLAAASKYKLKDLIDLCKKVEILEKKKSK